MEVVILVTGVVLLVMFLIRVLGFFGMIGLVTLILVGTFFYQQGEELVGKHSTTQNSGEQSK